MNINYHGIIINASQKDQTVFNDLKVLGRHESSRLNWILYKVEVDNNEIESIIIKLQNNLIPGKYYFHFYRNNELIIVFKDKIFKASIDKSTWKEAFTYGIKMGITEQQLDFKPCRIEDEKY